ncbi:MAG: hypothetical protein HC880_06865 [Bacteroidia bacterium]|nr:hypothetical protein [Bacteroidia bacterium]
MITQAELERIILEAYESMKDSEREWIETEQLFVDLYGDTYLEIKRELLESK